jgi:hypothetical protein
MADNFHATRWRCPDRGIGRSEKQNAGNTTGRGEMTNPRVVTEEKSALT